MIALRVNQTQTTFKSGEALALWTAASDRRFDRLTNSPLRGPILGGGFFSVKVLE
jgi:hypothetical protein